MFEQLFKRPHALARQRAGPVPEERLRYLAHRAAQGMARLTLQETAVYLLVVARSLRLADRPGELISPAEVERQALLWADQPHPCKPTGSARAREHFRSHAFAWLRFLGRLQSLPVAPHPCAQEIDAFAEFLRD